MEKYMFAKYIAVTIYKIEQYEIQNQGKMSQDFLSQKMGSAGQMSALLNLN